MQWAGLAWGLLLAGRQWAMVWAVMSAKVLGTT
jgi:hypothetical protein